MENYQFDIIVAGGGSAGSAAAIAAARRGHRVLLVEEQNCLGGTSTAGGVGEWFASLSGMGDIFASTRKELQQYGACSGRFFNPEYLKFAWQTLAEHAGVHILFHASVIGVEHNNKSLNTVRIACCSQELLATAAFYIDATGEGDLAVLSGAEYNKGSPGSGLTLHMTLTGWLFDTGKAVTPYLPEGLSPICSDEDLPGLGSGIQIDDGRVYLNSTKVVRQDPTKPFSLSLAELEARRQLIRIVHYVQRTRFPTYALGGSGARIGIREGRRVIGDYLLRHDEILHRETPLNFEDGIAIATSQIDFHSLTKSGNAGWRQKVWPYAIPLRCLIVKGINNLMVAGKCISADQITQSSCRMTPTCCAMGQAAGTATALAIETEVQNIRHISVSVLRSILAEDGIELVPEKHDAFAPHDTRLDPDDDPAD